MRFDSMINLPQWFVAIALPLAVVGAATPSEAIAQSDVKSVTAIGKAAGTDLKAKDEARSDAKRNAVQQACGELINAQSQVQDFALKRDRILSTAAGYLTSEKVTREWDDGQYAYCEILATVSVGKFQVDWAALFAHLREDAGNPRCVMVITEDNDVDDTNPPKVNGVCQSKLENYFLKHDVQLMDKGVSEDVRTRDVTLAAINDDITALAAQAAAFKADVLVYGRAEAKQGGTKVVGDHALHSWDVTLNVRVIQADSAKLLASNTYRPKKPFTSTMSASGDRGFEKLADEVAGQLLKDIAEAWKKRLTSHQVFDVQLEGCSRSDFRNKVAPALLKVRGVQQGDEGVKLREVVNNLVSAEVYWAYDLDTLADALESLAVEGMSFEIVEQSANRIRAKVIPKP